jgi:hypothetical protein
MHTTGQNNLVDEISTHFYICSIFWRDRENGKFVVVCILTKYVGESGKNC